MLSPEGLVKVRGFTLNEIEHCHIWDQRKAGLNWLLNSVKMQIKQCWNTFESKNLCIKLLIIHNITPCKYYRVLIRAHKTPWGTTDWIRQSNTDIRGTQQKFPMVFTHQPTHRTYAATYTMISGSLAMFLMSLFSNSSHSIFSSHSKAEVLERNTQVRHCSSFSLYDSLSKCPPTCLSPTLPEVTVFVVRRPTLGEMDGNCLKDGCYSYDLL